MASSTPPGPPQARHAAEAARLGPLVEAFPYRPGTTSWGRPSACSGSQSAGLPVRSPWALDRQPDQQHALLPRTPRASGRTWSRALRGAGRLSELVSILEVVLP